MSQLPRLLAILGPDGLPYLRAADPCKRLATTFPVGQCGCGGTPTGLCGEIVGPGCPCANSPGCDSVVGYPAVYINIVPGSATEVYRRPQDCCCGQNVSVFATATQRQDGPGAEWYMYQWAANGTGPVIQVVRTYSDWTGFVQSTPYQAGVPCAAGDQGYGMQATVGVPSFPDQNRSNGFFYRDCTRSHSLLIEPDSFGRRLFWERIVYHSPNPGSCLTPNCPRGACCCDGQCYGGVSRGECEAMIGGVYRGDGSECYGVSCATPGQRPKGSCCRPDGSCVLSAAGPCLSSGGIYRGDGTACATANCPPPPPSACCLPGGGCILTDSEGCSANGGIWWPGRGCNEIDCLQPIPRGACCLPSGACQNSTTSAECFFAGGVWQGSGTDCGNVNCASPVGACCSQISQHGRGCTQETEADCLLLVNPVWYGAGVPCESVNCDINPIQIVVPASRGCSGCGIVEGLTI